MVVVAVKCGSTSGIDWVAQIRLPEGLAKIIASMQKTTARPKMTPEILELSLMNLVVTRRLQVRTRLVLVARSFAALISNVLAPTQTQHLSPDPDTRDAAPKPWEKPPFHAVP